MRFFTNCQHIREPWEIPKNQMMRFWLGLFTMGYELENHCHVSIGMSEENVKIFWRQVSFIWSLFFWHTVSVLNFQFVSSNTLVLLDWEGDLFKQSKLHTYELTFVLFVVVFLSSYLFCIFGLGGRFILAIKVANFWVDFWIQTSQFPSEQTRK